MKVVKTAIILFGIIVFLICYSTFLVVVCDAQELKTVAEKVDVELQKDNSKSVVVGILKLHGLNVKQDKNICLVLSNQNYNTIKAINKDTSYIKSLNIKPVSNVVIAKSINKSEVGFFDKVVEFIKDIF